MSTSGPWIEKWIELKPLGGGGQGDTLLVRSKSDDTNQAVLKLLKPHKAQDSKARRRMYQEVANLKILRSAGGKVPEVLDGNTESFDKLDVPMYFLMEFIVGDTLANLVKQNSAFSVDISIRIALELCSILRVAAKEGIVHRDIKPDRGLSNELDARFQTVEELIGRLNEVANPAANLPVEDLETVVARESLALRKNDRKIQLTEFFQNAMPLRQSLEQCVNTIAQTLAKHRTFSAGLIQTLDRVNSKVAEGDCFAQWIIRIQVRDHPLSFDIHYTIVAHGNECEIGREVLQNSTTVQRQPIDVRQVVFRYQGDAELDRAAIVADVRAAVTRAISRISETVRKGY
jgi:hypothetical protein